MKYKISVLLCMIMMLNAVSFFGYAESSDEDIKLTREDVISLAIAYSDVKENLEDNIFELQKADASLYRAKESQEKMKESMDESKAMLKKMGLPVPDSLYFTAEDEFNIFYAVQIQYEEIHTQLLQLQNTLETIDIQIASGTDQLLSNYFYLNEMVEAQTYYMDLQMANFDNLKQKYDMGLISENDYLDGKNQRDIAIYQFRQMIINRDNLELELRKLTGLEDKQKVVWIDSYLDDKDRTLEEYDVYLDLTLNNKVDIKNSALAVESAEKKLDLYMSALYDITNQYKGDLAILDAKATYNQAVKTAEVDLYSNYSSIKQIAKAIELNQIDLRLSEWQYEKAKASYEVGYITENDLNMSQYGIMMKEIEKHQNERKIVIALDELLRGTVQ